MKPPGGLCAWGQWAGKAGWLTDYRAKNNNVVDILRFVSAGYFSGSDGSQLVLTATYHNRLTARLPQPPWVAQPIYPSRGDVIERKAGSGKRSDQCPPTLDTNNLPDQSCIYRGRGPRRMSHLHAYYIAVAPAGHTTSWRTTYPCAPAASRSATP